MRLLCLIALLLSPCFCFSQNEYSLAIFRLDSAKANAGTFAEFSFNSPTLTNDFFSKFINGGTIDSTLKNNVSNRLLPLNRIGGDLNYGIHFSQRINSLFKKPLYGFGWFFSATDRQHLDVRFRDDFFRLGFYGNKPFAGDTVDIGNFETNFMRYQQLRLGLLHNNGMGRTIGFGASFLKGEEHLRMKAGQLNLYTSTIGDTLALEAKTQVQRSDTGSSGPTAFNGWGLSADFFCEFDYDVFGNRANGTGLLRLEASDLGFIQWNKHSLNYRVDTSYFYEGLVINDIFTLTDSIIQGTVDSLKSSYTVQQGTGNYWQILPASFRMTVIQRSSKHTFTVSMLYRIRANFSPYFFVREQYHLSKTVAVGGRLAYGGYGKLAAGIEAGIHWKGFRLLAGWNNIEGLLLPGKTAGFGGFVMLNKSF